MGMGISEGEELQEFRSAYESGYADGRERALETQERGSAPRICPRWFRRS